MLMMGAVTTVVGLGAWCDSVTPDEYRQRLVRDGWRATVERQSGARDHPAPFAPRSTEEVEELVEDFKQGLSFVVHEFAELADGRRLTLHEERGFNISTMASSGPAPSDQVALPYVGGPRAGRAHHGAAGHRRTSLASGRSCGEHRLNM